MTALLRTARGNTQSLHVERWHGPPTDEELRLLADVNGPVLDVGCGPGRHARALAERGVVVMGVDASPAAVQVARSRGVPVLERSIFARIPGAGRWVTALLLDGNIGIGGEPVALLRRLARLLHQNGTVVAEVSHPSTSSEVSAVRLECEGQAGPWFPWATVSATDIESVATEAGMNSSPTWCDGGRWFARLAR